MTPKQKAALAVLELTKRRQQKAPIYDLSFKAQNDFVQDPSRYVSALCTRRAGKSSGLGIKFINAARKHANSLSVYISLTRDSARNIFWPILTELKTKHNLECELLESKLIMKFANGSEIKLVGADQKGFIEKLRGPKYPLAAVDEAQAFGAHLQSLIDEVLDPATADYIDGQIVMTGTPSPVPKGFFYEVTQGAYGFSNHEWTVYENPYFPRPHEYVADLFLKKGWDENNPTYRREWLGEWVADQDALVYRFNHVKNVIDKIPTNEREWFYVLGIDLGYDPDPSAFVLCAYSHYQNSMFIIDTHLESKMTVSDVAERIRYYMKVYQPKLVMDAGAQGKMIAEEIRQRYDLPIIAAEKHGKAGFIEIMNSDFQASLIKAVKGKAEPLIDEWTSLIWDAEKDQRVEDSRYPNHLADAALYAWRYCYNYVRLTKQEKKPIHSEEKINDFWERESSKIQNRQENETESLFGTIWDD